MDNMKQRFLVPISVCSPEKSKTTKTSKPKKTSKTAQTYVKQTEVLFKSVTFRDDIL